MSDGGPEADCGRQESRSISSQQLRTDAISRRRPGAIVCTRPGRQPRHRFQDPRLDRRVIHIAHERQTESRRLLASLTSARCSAFAAERRPVRPEELDSDAPPKPMLPACTAEREARCRSSSEGNNVSTLTVSSLYRGWSGRFGLDVGAAGQPDDSLDLLLTRRRLSSLLCSPRERSEPESLGLSLPRSPTARTSLPPGRR